MEIIENIYEKVAEYQGHLVYKSTSVPKEWVAFRQGNSIVVNPEAFAILKSRPDFLERIYRHEIEADDLHDGHDCADKDILKYLSDKGYDFGSYRFDAN